MTRQPINYQRFYFGSLTPEGTQLFRLDTGHDESEVRIGKPSTFAWGGVYEHYRGTKRLALAVFLLTEAVGERCAIEHADQFARDVVGAFDPAGWSMTREQAVTWVAETSRAKITGE